MAGGTWISQNKIRPGVYIRFQSTENLSLNASDRGVVTICEPLSWGPVAQVREIEAGADMTPYTVMTSQMRKIASCRRFSKEATERQRREKCFCIVQLRPALHRQV